MAVVTRRMRCTPQEVLDVLADGWTYSAWVVGTSRTREVDDEWPAPGSSIHHSFGAWPAVINDSTRALAWDPERGIEMQARGWPAGEARVRIEVAPRADGCSVRITEDAVRGPGTLVPKILRTAVLVPRNTETLRRLELLAGGRARRAARDA